MTKRILMSALFAAVLATGVLTSTGAQAAAQWHLNFSEHAQQQ